MDKESKIPKMDKRLETLAAETEKNKRALVAQLRRTPIVQAACERTGVGRSTYYKWRAEDFIFGRAADSALESGKFFINDMAESQIIRLIREGNLTASIFWLKFNHPAYTKRFIHEHDIVCDRESTEEKHIDREALIKMVNRRHPSPFTAEDLKAEAVEEEQNAESDEKIEKQLETYRQDPESS